MSKTNEDILVGSGKVYRIHPEIKKYALKDFGFNETSPGKFRYERHLGERATDRSTPVLKITISNDLSKLKISTTNSGGLKKINLFEEDKFGIEQMIVDTILFELVEAQILEEVAN